MTREQKQKVLDALRVVDRAAETYCACIGDATCDDCAMVKEAVEIMNAELASEAREWRAVGPTGRCASFTHDSPERPLETDRSDGAGYSLQSRTKAVTIPAGQWEAER